MTIVNFTISDTLDRQVRWAIREKGFQSKAELFRVAIINFIDNLRGTVFMNEDEKFTYLTSKLEEEIGKKLEGKKLPSLKKQLDAI